MCFSRCMAFNRHLLAPSFCKFCPLFIRLWNFSGDQNTSSYGESSSIVVVTYEWSVTSNLHVPSYCQFTSSYLSAIAGESGLLDYSALSVGRVPDVSTGLLHCRILRIMAVRSFERCAAVYEKSQLYTPDHLALAYLPKFSTYSSNSSFEEFCGGKGENVLRYNIKFVQ